MSPDGYLPVQLIASFPRVRNLTEDLALIGEALKDSKKVELSPDGLVIRARENPERWPLLPTVSGVADSMPGTSQAPPPQQQQQQFYQHQPQQRQQNGPVAAAPVAPVVPVEQPSSSGSQEPQQQQQEEQWEEVKSKKNKGKSRQTSGSQDVKKTAASAQKPAQEHSGAGDQPELDFQFDNELSGGGGPASAATPKRADKSKKSLLSAIDSEEIGDDVISKLIIMTPSRRTLDRTGDFSTRAQNQSEFNESVEIGLRIYEEELWQDPKDKDAPVSDKKLSVISNK